MTVVMHRRQFLSGVAALSGAVSFGGAPSAFAQRSTVFLDYDQTQLDEAYDQSYWAPTLNELQLDDRRVSAEVRSRMPPRTEHYGPAEIELIDIFTPATAKGAPILVYFHGGAWLFNSRLDASFPAPTVVGRGAAFLAPDFNTVKDVRLPVMIEQCREAVAWTARNAGSFGGDPDRIYIAGHSSGAHLTSCVLITDWEKRGLPADTVKGALVMSGMYDLYPAMLSSRGRYVNITPAEQAAASAMRHLDRIACPVAVTWAVSESPEFRRQSMTFASALEGMGRLESRTEVFTANHFTEPRQLDRPDTQVSRALFNLMKI
ncbi:arylformamidase [Rhodoligotrophos appendicifer]|uniref:alpha/beta hydrolase n=1 Tax=Rhodoligotrophos appendicifer TaxID=987056 RepID=UPI0011851951|nr:alpha/beta hydrolase [Rhodoligotrophos appendicifer]